MKGSLKKLGLTTCLRLSGVALQTLIIMVVGRLVGPAGVGALQVFLTWTCSLGETAAAGLPTQAMRNLANMDSDRAQAGLFFKAAAKRMAVIWLTLMLGATAGLYLGLIESVLELSLIAVSVFCFGLYRIVSESLKAFRDVDFSVLVESSLPPLVAAITLAAFYGLELPITINLVLSAFALGFFVTACVLILRLIKLMGGFYTLKGTADTLDWQEHAPFWVSAIVSIAFLNYPFFVLPYFADLTEIGTFALAFKLLNICTTILLLLGAIFGPKFSQLTKQGDFDGAAELLKTSRMLSLVAFTPIGLALIALFPVIHPWFGEGFANGFDLLLILMIGQLFNAATGLSGQFLNMAGAGALEMKIQIISLLIAACMTPLAGALGGAMGIAIVYSVTVVLRSTGSLWYANRLVAPRSHLAMQI